MQVGGFHCTAGQARDVVVIPIEVRQRIANTGTDDLVSTASAVLDLRLGVTNRWNECASAVRVADHGRCLND